MSRQQKFNFVPATIINKPQSVHALWIAFSPQTKLLSFNKKHNPEVEDYRGRYVKLFADVEKRMIAWAFAPKEWKKPEELKGYDSIRSYGKGDQQQTVSIYVPKQLCDVLKMNQKFKRVTVEVYKPASPLDNNTYYYVNLNDINNDGEEKQTA